MWNNTIYIYILIHSLYYNILTDAVVVKVHFKFMKLINQQRTKMIDTPFYWVLLVGYKRKQCNQCLICNERTYKIKDIKSTITDFLYSIQRINKSWINITYHCQLVKIVTQNQKFNKESYIQNNTVHGLLFC